jgi:acyl-coenzyme A thioesterase PaaI-like protein
MCGHHTGPLGTWHDRAVSESLQERYAPASICYGCGPANARGLHVRSVVQGDLVVADWTPEPHHEAFPGMVNGGIIGTILDCHCNWTAAWHLMQAAGLEHPPCTVTAEYTIALKRPTPMGRSLHLAARVVEARADRCTVEATLTAEGRITATCRGLFVAVREGHPAYHRW